MRYPLTLTISRPYNSAMALRFPAAASEADFRAAIVECGRICYERRLMVSTDGNISVRVNAATALITPAGVPKARLAADDIVLIDLHTGEPTSQTSGQPSSETPMHLEVYKGRPDARAVIHAHPVFVTALTVAGLSFPSDILPEVLLTVGEVPVTTYATPSSHEDADAVKPFIQDHSSILLRQHGALTFGTDLEEALMHLERIEHVAEVFWRASMLGHVEHLTREARERLLAMRRDQRKK